LRRRARFSDSRDARLHVLLGGGMPASTQFRRAFEGKSVLITGGLGFIGSNLARTLVGLGARVSIVDSLVPQYGGNRRNLAGIRDRVTSTLPT
jgi:FlaA1/EpsC-like NDP-sugar epimerase